MPLCPHSFHGSASAVTAFWSRASLTASATERAVALRARAAAARARALELIADLLRAAAATTNPGVAGSPTNADAAVSAALGLGPLVLPSLADEALRAAWALFAGTAGLPPARPVAAAAAMSGLASPDADLVVCWGKRRHWAEGGCKPSRSEVLHTRHLSFMEIEGQCMWLSGSHAPADEHTLAWYILAGLSPQGIVPAQGSRLATVRASVITAALHYYKRALSQACALSTNAAAAAPLLPALLAVPLLVERASALTPAPADNAAALAALARDGALALLARASEQLEPARLLRHDGGAVRAPAAPGTMAQLRQALAVATDDPGCPTPAATATAVTVSEPAGAASALGGRMARLLVDALRGLAAAVQRLLWLRLRLIPIDGRRASSRADGTAPSVTKEVRPVYADLFWSEAPIISPLTARWLFEGSERATTEARDAHVPLDSMLAAAREQFLSVLERALAGAVAPAPTLFDGTRTDGAAEAEAMETLALVLGALDATNPNAALPTPDARRLVGDLAAALELGLPPDAPARTTPRLIQAVTRALVLAAPAALPRGGIRGSDSEAEAPVLRAGPALEATGARPLEGGGRGLVCLIFGRLSRLLASGCEPLLLRDLTRVTDSHAGARLFRHALGAHRHCREPPRGPCVAMLTWGACACEQPPSSTRNSDAYPPFLSPLLLYSKPRMPNEARVQRQQHGVRTLGVPRTGLLAFLPFALYFALSTVARSAFLPPFSVTSHLHRRPYALRSHPPPRPVPLVPGRPRPAAARPALQ